MIALTLKRVLGLKLQCIMLLVEDMKPVSSAVGAETALHAQDIED